MRSRAEQLGLNKGLYLLIQSFYFPTHLSQPTLRDSSLKKLNKLSEED